jgi:hypothetical protein
MEIVVGARRPNGKVEGVFVICFVVHRPVVPGRRRHLSLKAELRYLRCCGCSRPRYAALPLWSGNTGRGSRSAMAMAVFGASFRAMYEQGTDQLQVRARAASQPTPTSRSAAPPTRSRSLNAPFSIPVLPALAPGPIEPPPFARPIGPIGEHARPPW